jgi:hypothetical protein
MRSVSALCLCLVVATGVAPRLASADTSAVGLQTEYSCAEAEKLKFDQKLYESKTPVDQRMIDARYQQCKINQEAAAKGEEPKERVVVVANAVPTGEHDRVFYGTIRTADLNNAEKNCKGGGMAAGIALTVVGTAQGMPGAAQAGGMVYEFTDVTCKGLSDAIRGDNLMVVLAPTQIVASAVGGKMINDFVARIPLVSDADKRVIQKTVSSATQPPKFIDRGDSIHIDPGIGGGIGIKKPKIF